MTPPVRICRFCPKAVPIVSDDLARAIAARFNPTVQKDLAYLCTRWLLERHEGLTLYQGLRGESLAPDERLAVAEEVGLVARLPCPFVVNGWCALGGCSAQPGWVREELKEHKEQFGFLPAMLLRVLDPETLRYLTQSHQIADAKVTGLWRRSGFPIPERRRTAPTIVPANPPSADQIVPRQIRSGHQGEHSPPHLQSWSH